MSEWKGKRVLITGISGFVGSSVARVLLNNGAHVTGIVRDINRKHNDLLGKVNVVFGDISNYFLMRDTISNNEIDVIFHFAAQAIVRISARDPLSTYNTNVMGTVALLEAARNAGRCSGIIVASSDKAYGDHEILPYTEDMALQPNNTYDTSKACMDMISRSYAKNYDMPICVTRCSNIYGPGDFNYSRIIPNTIRRVLDEKKPVLYSDIEKMEREFIFIGDVVDAYMMLGLETEKLKGQALNIGGTGAVRIRDLVKIICEEIGKPDLEPEIVQRESIFKEIGKQYIDAGKLRKAVGWVPQTELRTGIKRSVEWYGRQMWGE